MRQPHRALQLPVARFGGSAVVAGRSGGAALLGKHGQPDQEVSRKRRGAKLLLCSEAGSKKDSAPGAADPTHCKTSGQQMKNTQSVQLGIAISHPNTMDIAPRPGHVLDGWLWFWLAAVVVVVVGNGDWWWLVVVVLGGDTGGCLIGLHVNS